jgi:hydrogenase-4 component B
LIGGIAPGLFIDALALVAMSLVGDRVPSQLVLPWLSIVPIVESRSSYNGLLVFLFVTTSASLTAYGALHPVLCAVAPAWGCGLPLLGPATQYTAGSFAQPIRMVFGTYVFRAREHVEMRPPGDLAPARFRAELHDLAWELIYTPITAAVSFAATRLNQLQFLTIRRNLSFVFSALVFLLLVLALWS